MSYVFYGQDSLVEDNTRYDEIGVFLPNSHFLKIWNATFPKQRRSFMQTTNSDFIDIMEKIIWRFHGMTTPMMTVMC